MFFVLIVSFVIRELIVSLTVAMICSVSKGKVVQTLTAIIANLLLLSDGMHYAWPSVTAPILQSSASAIGQVTHNQITMLEMMYLIGGLAALPYVMYIPDKFGRKYTILGAILSSLISWVLIAGFPSVTSFTIARFLAGLTADIGYVSIPMYIAEIAEKDIRGSLSGIIYMMITMGVLIMYSIGPFLLISTSALVGVFANIFALIFFSFLPESPYYFLKINQLEKAEKSLSFLRGGINVKIELTEIEAAVERQELEKGTFSDLITSKGNRKALTLIILAYVLQSVSGIHVMFMNVNAILEETSHYVLPAYGAILYAIVLLITGCISMFIVDRFGRKRLLSTSGIVIGIVLATLATFSYLQTHYPHITKIYDWIPLFCILLYAAGLRIGIGFIPLILNGELFPTSVKAKGMTIAETFYLVSGIICIYSYREISNELGMYIPLYTLACGTVLITLIIHIYLPETKGKTLEEIQLMLLK